jgi:hypothetical protein
MKKCSKCKQEKQKCEFYKDKSQKTGLNSICIACQKEKDKKRFSSELGIITMLKTQYKRKYNITIDDYYRLYEVQNGKCAICDAEDPGAKKGRLFVDHDHRTKEIRGLLCYSCNMLLGHSKDNSKILSKAIQYLTKGENNGYT